MKSIYDLKLHQELEISNFYWVIRVPGGWIYHHKSKELGSVFVPYSLECEHKTLREEYHKNDRMGEKVTTFTDSSKEVLRVESTPVWPLATGDVEDESIPGETITYVDGLGSYETAREDEVQGSER